MQVPRCLWILYVKSLLEFHDKIPTCRQTDLLQISTGLAHEVLQEAQEATSHPRAQREAYDL